MYIEQQYFSGLILGVILVTFRYEFHIRFFFAMRPPYMILDMDFLISAIFAEWTEKAWGFSTLVLFMSLQSSSRGVLFLAIQTIKRP